MDQVLPRYHSNCYADSQCSFQVDHDCRLLQYLSRLRLTSAVPSPLPSEHTAGTTPFPTLPLQYALLLAAEHPIRHATRLVMAIRHCLVPRFFNRGARRTSIPERLDHRNPGRVNRGTPTLSISTCQVAGGGRAADTPAPDKPKFIYAILRKHRRFES